MYEEKIEELTQSLNNYKTSFRMLNRKESSLSNESPEKGNVEAQNLAK